jgi:hypothetical protein
LLVWKGFPYILAPPMAGQPGRTHVRVDGDGVRIATDPGARAIVRWLAAGIALVVVAVVGTIVAIRLAPGRGDASVPAADLAPRPAADTHVAAAIPAPVATATTPPGHAMPHTTPKPPPPTPPFDGDPPPDKPAPMFEFAKPGEKTGVALFPPPGTKPLKRGLVVPDDFELPPGYVRHYQSTDDGKQLPAILMFHPDYQPVDAQGRPIPLPPDRIVPPEMAPPGLPLHTLDVPKQPTPDH